MPAHNCPLCRCLTDTEFCRDRRRTYWQCPQCELVFAEKSFWLCAADEKAEYDLHENSVVDVRYRQFLNRLAAPLMQRISVPARGLDFGCGPGPALQAMLQEVGFEVDVYDIFYAPDPGVFKCGYDFITATEVVEHLHDPKFELNRLWSMLHPGGYLAIMTKRVQGQAAFANWHYKNDPTHVCFFSETTFYWLADSWQASVEFPASDVVLLQKPART
ncbi:class I SAM-dependent methyltransferase [Gilvimarinus sp. SDUM040013]|uniref:Class I SAM-dependent methyltransferase n=1 Tax=Gilvimarinus gilvus TaxID=3058038 RepID=A0ABU4RTA1_9GAMM|nr:class I SAM-dependent methyltransferase [Gilvimarinus sp. SDUM040013]MDO3386993.1 class I SAM-dependent methyltransferase [Gilvimarinus sp. SDUM040013]MDX6848113.1 class I SAM-dependent methyltransferase [Gilvimarinus sp. SDUM040013]